jgi:putative hydrolase of the HAD superfamily
MHVQGDNDIRAVLLDLDDTLTDRAASVRSYARRFVADFGPRFRIADVSIVAAEITRIDRNGYNRDRALELAGHDAWVVAPCADDLTAHWNHHFALCTQGRAGLLPTVDALALAGLRIGVVTNGATDRQRRKLEALQLRDRLGAVLISEECGAAKPNARIFRAAAAALDVDPRECLFVGDNPRKDVIGSAAVGMRAVWFRAKVRWPEELAPPRESIAALAELLALPGVGR